MSEDSPFLTQATLSQQIETMVLEEGFSYFDAMVAFAAEADRSPEELMPFVSKVLLEKIQKSAYDEGYAKNTALSLQNFEDGTE